MPLLNLRGCLFLCCLLTIYGIYAQDKPAAKEKTIKNQLYSFTVPAHWQVSNGVCKAGNENIPFERDDKYFHRYYLNWNSAIEEFYQRTSLDIDSFRTLDGSPLSIDKVERIAIPGTTHPLIRSSKKTYLSGKKGQKRILIEQEEANLSGEYHQVYYFYLLQQDKEIVHCLSIHIRKEIYDKQPSAAKVIDKILDSFTINQE